MFIVKKSNECITLSGSSTYRVRHIIKKHGTWLQKKKHWRVKRKEFEKLLGIPEETATENDLGRYLYYRYIQKDGAVIPSSTKKHKHYCIIRKKYCDCDGFKFRNTCKHINI